MMRIQALSLQLANQIAAGEVIERPASVVKELLENAYDSGATEISVDLRYGGLNLIRIADNGCGIHPDDLPLTIAPHATSKIVQVEDLFSIKSMGFRGEALASISSVSRFNIMSRREGFPLATGLMFEAGKTRLYSSARAIGTTVEVSDLFYNTPVRKKFLKSERTEFLAIDSVLKRFALSAMNVRLTLSHNGQVLWTLNQESGITLSSQRIKKIMGKSCMDHASFVDYHHDELQVTGFVTNTDYRRHQSDKIMFYVNQRMVRDSVLIHALKQAYEYRLPPGIFPAAVLFLTVNPSQVDVNVHPTKHEVRFQEPRIIHDGVVRAIEDTLGMSSKEVPDVKKAYHAALSQQNFKMHEPILNMNKQEQELIVDNHFMFFEGNGQSFCVDLLKAHQHWLIDFLGSLIKPWAKRAVLVPWFFKHPKLSMERHQSYLTQFLDVGLDINFVSEQTLAVRAIPAMIPTLDVRSMLQHLCDKDSLIIDDSGQWLTQWIPYIPDPALHVSLKNYINQTIETSSNMLPPYIKLLTPTFCRAFFDE